MPELPDITVYVEALGRRVVGHILRQVRVVSPFLVRTFDPKLDVLVGRRIDRVGRLGKRIVFSFDGELHAVLHLMVAGRLRFTAAGAKLPGRLGLAAFDFDHGTLMLTEASKKKRASLHVVRGADGLTALDPGGIDVFEADEGTFAAALREHNHTLKRALTDPRIVAGIGNAYSDEILHRAGLSPLVWTSRLDDATLARLFTATRDVLAEWTERLRAEVGDGFPDKVTAFRETMAAHGKFGQPCPRCGTKIQRIVRAANQVSYCPTCQTGGKLLSDRALSRLLRGDWPRTLEELDELKRARTRPPSDG